MCLVGGNHAQTDERLVMVVADIRQRICHLQYDNTLVTTRHRNRRMCLKGKQRAVSLDYMCGHMPKCGGEHVVCRHMLRQEPRTTCICSFQAVH